MQKSLPWHRLLTQRLSEDVKLVGPVISCEGSPYQGNVTDHWRTNPHVQSYVLAMDQEALQILKKDNTVLNCYNDRWDAVYFGELGSSLAVLKADKNIDSLLTKCVFNPTLQHLLLALSLLVCLIIYTHRKRHNSINNAVHTSLSLDRLLLSMLDMFQQQDHLSPSHFAPL